MFADLFKNSKKEASPLSTTTLQYQRPLFRPRPRQQKLYIIFLLLWVGLAGCVHHSQPGYIADLSEMPQDPLQYIFSFEQRISTIDQARQEEMAQGYRSRYFLPWQSESPLYASDNLYWGLAEFEGKTLYAAQGLPYPEGWWTSLRANAHQNGFPSMNRAGITVRTAHLRVLPTQEPVFFNPDQAGQGYPFDMMQNSVLWTNTPVQVVHRSRDKAWLLVETGWVFGWVRADDVAWVDEDQRERLENCRLLAVTRDKVSLMDNNGSFQSMARIGTLLLALDETQNGYHIAFPARGEGGQAVIRSALVDSEAVSPFPLELSAKRVAGLAGQMMGQVYGWGGLYARRDCSAGMRDLFTPFGLWLPRNSSQQAQAGRVLDLSDFSAQEKEEFILEHGVPFMTLLWKPGHIMLYIGRYENRAAVWHILWGVKTKGLWAGEGRHVVGRTVVTSLRPGNELNNLARPEGLLINGIEGMVFLGPGMGQEKHDGS
ncbi:MAG: SH3 domain-containing protein [Desulfovermiculus sp.]|nr:SH3 domain-containing protein [Desulfovermiculus sp.]